MRTVKGMAALALCLCAIASNPVLARPGRDLFATTARSEAIAVSSGGTSHVTSTSSATNGGQAESKAVGVAADGSEANAESTAVAGEGESTNATAIATAEQGKEATAIAKALGGAKGAEVAATAVAEAVKDGSGEAIAIAVGEAIKGGHEDSAVTAVVDAFAIAQNEGTGKAYSEALCIGLVHGGRTSQAYAAAVSKILKQDGCEEVKPTLAVARSVAIAEGKERPFVDSLDFDESIPECIFPKCADERAECCGSESNGCKCQDGKCAYTLWKTTPQPMWACNGPCEVDTCIC